MPFEHRAELGGEDGAFARERIGAMRRREFEAHVGAGYGSARRFNQQREVDWFDGTLEPIPLR